MMLRIRRLWSTRPSSVRGEIILVLLYLGLILWVNLVLLELWLMLLLLLSRHFAYLVSGRHWCPDRPSGRGLLTRHWRLLDRRLLRLMRRK